MTSEEQPSVPPPPPPFGADLRPGAADADSGKRKDYLSWDTYFMGVAFLTGMRSKDPSTQVGAVIVNPDNRIVGVGYNGFPGGIKDEELPWAKDADGGFLDTKYPYVCHAELNAILNKNVESCRGCRLYSTLYPCCECAKVILQSGIRHVIYASDKNRDKDVFKASKRLFRLAGVRCESWAAEFPELRIPLLDPDELPQLRPSAPLPLPSSEPSDGGGSAGVSSSLSTPSPKSASSSDGVLKAHAARQVVVTVGLGEAESEAVRATLSQDYEVQHLSHSDACVSVLRAKAVDLVLLDVATIGTNTWHSGTQWSLDVCRKIREDSGMSKEALPIIALCAEGAASDVPSACLDAGCNDYFSKPIVKNLLLARVSTALRAKRLHDLEVMQAASSPEGQEGEASGKSPAKRAGSEPALETPAKQLRITTPGKAEPNAVETPRVLAKAQSSPSKRAPVGQGGHLEEYIEMTSGDCYA